MRTEKELADIISAIKDDLIDGVIKDSRITSLLNTETCEPTGAMVEFNLSSKFTYRNNFFEDLNKQLDSDYYAISVSRNQLWIKFYIHK